MSPQDREFRAISLPFRRVISSIAFLFLLILFIVYCLVIPQSPCKTELMANQSKFLTIYTEIDPPYAYLDRTGGVRGKSIELVKLLAEHTDTEYTLEFLPWSASYGRTLSTPGTALVPTTWNEERAPLFRWVGPIDTIQYAFFARADDPVRVQVMPDDVQAVSHIAVVKNTAKYKELIMENITNLMTFPNEYDCIDALLTGTVDLWCGTDDMFMDTKHLKGSEHTKIRRVYQWKTKPVYIAFNIDTPDDVIRRWQNAYDALDTGVKGKLHNQYLPYYCSWIDCLPDSEKSILHHAKT